MTSPNKSIDKFHYGEGFDITINGKNRDKSALSTPDSQVVTFKISNTKSDDALVTITATQPTSGIATWLVQVTAADYSGILREGQRYYYNAWSTLGAADPILQAHGRFTLQPSI